MFRRKLSFSGIFICQPLLCVKRPVIVEDPGERQKERELREKVLQRYRAMKLPELTNIRYGHFAEQDGARIGASYQAYNAVSQGFSPGASSSAGKGGVDWLMLLTGFALVYASTKVFMSRFSPTDMNEVGIPLWTASLETQAKFLLFAIQFDVRTREQIRQAYQDVRRAYPFTDFFHWLRVHHPEYGQGIVFGYEAAVSSLVAILSSGDSKTLMTLSRAVQKALLKRSTNAAEKIDEFMTDIGALSGTQRMGGNFQPSGYMPSHPPPQAFQVYGSEPVTIQNALEATPREQHSSVPF